MRFWLWWFGRGTGEAPSVLDLKCTSSVPLWRSRTSESLIPDRIAVSGMPSRTSDCNCDC